MLKRVLEWVDRNYLPIALFLISVIACSYVVYALARLIHG